MNAARTGSFVPLALVTALGLAAPVRAQMYPGPGRHAFDSSPLLHRLRKLCISVSVRV